MLLSFCNGKVPTEIDFFIKKNHELRILFLGGSITEGALSSRADYRYVNRVIQYLKSRYPGFDIKFINGGKGSTPSNIGHFINNDLIETFGADLVFLDYSVNDASDEIYIESYEGLVRNIFQNGGIPIPILFIRKDGSSAREIHEKIIDHYNLWSIDFFDPLTRITQTEEWEYYYADNVHPNDRGHELIALTILEAGLISYKNTYLSNDISEPLTKNRFQNIEYYAVNEIIFSEQENFSLVTGTKFDSILKSNGRSASLNTSIDADNIVLICEADRFSGELIINVDGTNYNYNTYKNIDIPIPYLIRLTNLGQGIHSVSVNAKDAQISIAGIGTF